MRIGRILALPLVGVALAGTAVLAAHGDTTKDSLSIVGDTPKQATQHVTVVALDVEFYVEQMTAPAFSGDAYVNE
jgi:hypothetical protein